jgi:hypothetical protein
VTASESGQRHSSGGYVGVGGWQPEKKEKKRLPAKVHLTKALDAKALAAYRGYAST